MKIINILLASTILTVVSVPLVQANPQNIKVEDSAHNLTIASSCSPFDPRPPCDGKGQ